jgi:hypothetical protein
MVSEYADLVRGVAWNQRLGHFGDYAILVPDIARILFGSVTRLISRNATRGRSNLQWLREDERELDDHVPNLLG